MNCKTIGDIIDQLEEEEKQEMTNTPVAPSLASEILRSQHSGLQDLKMLVNEAGNQFHDAFCVFVVNPGEIYIRLHDQEEELKVMQKALDHYCSKSFIDRHDIRRLNQHDTLIVKSVHFNVWSRAVFVRYWMKKTYLPFPADPLNSRNDVRYVVYLIDYGIVEYLSRENILASFTPEANSFTHRKYPDAFDLTKYPVKLIKCCLERTVPAFEMKEWTKESIDLTRYWIDLIDKKKIKVFVEEIDRLGTVFVQIQYGKQRSPLKMHLIFCDVARFTARRQFKYILDEPELEAFGIEDQPQLKETFDALVSHVESPSMFYVLRAKNLYRLEKLNDLLNKRYSEYARNQMKRLETILYGQPCVCRWYQDKKFYRATLLEKHTELNLLSVMFIDYGNIDNVSVDDVYSVDDDLMEIGSLSYQCYLPIQSNKYWMKEECQSFKSWISQYVFGNEVLKVKILASCSQQKSFEVILNPCQDHAENSDTDALMTQTFLDLEECTPSSSLF